MPGCELTSRRMRRGFARGGCFALALVASCSVAGDAFVSRDSLVPSDAGASAPGGGLCGGPNERCCAAPLPACALDLECDPTSFCRPASGPPLCSEGPDTCEAEPARSRLCRSSRDCALDETCCMAGPLGTCLTLEPSAQCPRPDLAIAFSGLGVSLPVTTALDACLGDCFETTGIHRLLQIVVRLFNLGEGDAVLGQPQARSADPACEPYIEDALVFELWDESGALVRQSDARLNPGCSSYGTQTRFSCELLGLERGFYDDAAAACPWLDISGVPAGRYTVRVRLELDPAVFPDVDPSNNRLELPITLRDSDDPTQPCPPEAEISLSDFSDCGWTVVPPAACRPGEVIVVGCPDCEGAPVMQLCAGEIPCSLTQGELLGGNGGNVCPNAMVVCPTSGVFTAMVSPLVPGESFRCEPTLQPYEPEPLAPCPSQAFLLESPSRECGWVMAPSERCVPGEAVALGCPVCEGSPLLRICDGESACLETSANALGSSSGHNDRMVTWNCPVVGFTCPEDGRYATLMASSRFDTSYSCALQRVEVIDPRAPCSDGIAPGWYEERGCGWSLAGEGACTPGETVGLECILCTGAAPVLRVCDGSNVCLPRSPAELVPAKITPGACPAASFVCPASGKYSAWATALLEETMSNACTLAVIP